MLSALILLLLVLLDLLLKLVLTDYWFLDLLGYFRIALRLLWVLHILPIRLRYGSIGSDIRALRVELGVRRSHADVIEWQLLRCDIW